MPSVESRLRELGVTLPEPPKPGGAYKPTIIAGAFLYVAAQFPIENGELKFQGRFGENLDVEQGRAAARLAAINVLAQINAALDGFDRLVQLIRVDGHFNTTPDFDQHARIMDGASELFNDALGDKAGHVRSVFGHASLPANLSVELMAIAQISG